MAETVIVDTPPPPPPPAPTRQINVSPSSIPNPVEPIVPKPGSAKERLFQNLRSKAKNTFEPAEQTPAPSQTQPATESHPQTPAPEEGAGAPAVGSEQTPASTQPPKKLTLGEALNNYKKKNRELEAEIATLRTSSTAIDTKALTERAATLETRNKELEEEIRYVNYSKSQEFRDKFETPYSNAWKRAMQDLSEVTIDDGNGNARAITGTDILEIVNMPLAKAREVSKAVFGEFADDVMQHRKEIKRLFDEQSQALADARKNGEAREKLRNEQIGKITSEIDGYIKTHWEKANSEAHSDPTYGSYFTPIEGDAEGNQRLAKGFELVDRAFAENPKDPRLNAEQRLAIIKRHAAVRNRAAGFGRLAWQNKNLKSENDQLKKKLGQYEGTVPAAGGSTGGTPPVSSSGSAKDRLFGSLRALAK